MDLILSAASTFLIPALPFVFVTSNSCVISLDIIERGLLPPSSTLTKLFWLSDVESLREEFASVRELGAPAVEEWQKGLSIRGSDQRADIAKWEKYDDSGGVANMRTLLYPGFRPKSVTQPAPQATTVPPKTDLPQPPTTSESRWISSRQPRRIFTRSQCFCSNRKCSSRRHRHSTAR